MTDTSDTGSIDGPATKLHPHIHIAPALALALSVFLAFVLTAFASEGESTQEVRPSSQRLALVTPQTFSQAHAHGGVIINHVDDALISVPLIADAGSNSVSNQGHYTNKYLVQSGDTVSGIASKFGVSQNTVIWANDLESKKLKVGQELTILPVTGVIHTISAGDTLEKIAERYDVEPEEIAFYNQLIAGSLQKGVKITVPGGVMPKPTIVATAKAKTSKPVVASGKPLKTVRSPSGLLEVTSGITYTWKNGVRTSRLRGTGGPSYTNFYRKPINAGRRSRGLHGFNAVDWAAPKGTPIVAAASGKVVVSKKAGWNGGYGNYAAIEHSNGSQTLYAHASSIIVSRGQNVVAGQVIGYVGSTGNSSGNHLHFEVRGAKNPF